MQPIDRPAGSAHGTPAHVHHPAPDLGGRSPWAILAVLCFAVFMLLLDTTIVNVAQQVIKRDLDASLTDIQWILDSYILAYAVLLLSFGRIGDIFGRKRMFIVGMAVFALASALCGASTWLAGLLGITGSQALIASRVLQGVGGALMMPQTLSLITVVFPPQQRGMAMGIWGSVISVGAILGPLIGGYIVTNHPWQWIFLINIPIAAVGILATLAIVPESRDPLASRRIDWAGVVLSGSAIFAFTFAMIEGAHLGWTNPVILGLVALSLVLLAAFVWWEKRAADPMMKLELFAIRNFSVGNVIAMVVSFGMLGIFFPMTLFLQGALGMSPMEAGLAMTPMSVVTLFAAPLAGKLSDRIGPRWILVTGLFLMTSGLLFLTSRVTPQTTGLSLLPALLVTGAGMGLTFAPMTAATMASVPPRIAGSASGILNTTRNVGQVLGIAILGSVLQTRLGTHGVDELTALGTMDENVVLGIAGLARDSRFPEIPGWVQANAPEQAAALPEILGAAQRAFVASIHDTFHVAAAACLLGMFTAFLIRNPRARGVVPPVPAGAPATRSASASASAD